MSGRIIAAGVAISLIAFAWQAGASFRGMVSAKVAHHGQPSAATASNLLPGVITLRTAWGNVVCHLGKTGYSCVTPQVAAPPALYTTARPQALAGSR